MRSSYDVIKVIAEHEDQQRRRQGSRMRLPPIPTATMQGFAPDKSFVSAAGTYMSQNENSTDEQLHGA